VSATTTDRNGAEVRVGSSVRVIEIDQQVFPSLESLLEVERLNSMRGQVFSVSEIDAHGNAWVEKFWPLGNGETDAHSLALAPSEMEVVAGGANCDA
jgi:hypothetical protein